MTAYNVAIVGGGCIGWSVAKHVTEASGLSVCVLEKEEHLALHQSGRNSGVLHPGFNYEPGSMKARFATEGTRRMKRYCREKGVPLREYGVVVVATSDCEFARLRELRARADENNVETSLLEDAETIREYEPWACGQAALHCPEAASVDSQQYVHALARDAIEQGVDPYLGHVVTGVDRTEGGFELTSPKGTITADRLVNAAGLYADELAHELGAGTEYEVIPFRGEYYELTTGPRKHVNSMIYPTPDPELPFLGVHFTRRTDNRVIVGPNAVLAFGREAYHNTDVDVRELVRLATSPGLRRLLSSPEMLRAAWDELNKSYRKRRFAAAAQRLVPAVEADDLVRSYAGNRAQLVSRDGDLVMDPLVVEDGSAVHVLNAVSPGLTSSLPFGEHVAERLLG